MKLKILSWNIWGGKYLNEVTAFLKDAGADIIALQEVIEDDRAGNTALTIAKELGYECVYGLGMLMSSKWAGPPREKEETIKFGNAILSKHVITSNKIHELSVSERRVAVQADLRIGGTTLHCFSVHLKHNHVERSNPKILQLQNEQADNLVKILPSEKTILMGDLNALPENYAVKRMSEVLKNIEKDPGSLTWSVYPEGCDGCLPKGIQYKLDYIFISEDIKVQSFEVGNSKGSDHLPISAIIET